jgi:hypothetical protein
MIPHDPRLIFIDYPFVHAHSVTISHVTREQCSKYMRTRVGARAINHSVMHTGLTVPWKLFWGILLRVGRDGKSVGKGEDGDLRGMPLPYIMNIRVEVSGIAVPGGEGRRSVHGVPGDSDRRRGIATSSCPSCNRQNSRVKISNRKGGWTPGPQVLSLSIPRPCSTRIRSLRILRRNRRSAVYLSPRLPF